MSWIYRINRTLSPKTFWCEIIGSTHLLSTELWGRPASWQFDWSHPFKKVWNQRHRIPANPPNWERRLTGHWCWHPSIKKSTRTNVLYWTTHQSHFSISYLSNGLQNFWPSLVSFKTTSVDWVSNFYFITNPVIQVHPTSDRFILEGYCDAALCKSLTKPHDERLGIITFRRCGDVAHPLHWGAQKLRRVPRSSTTAKTLAVPKPGEVMLYLQKLLKSSTMHITQVLSRNSRLLLNYLLL